MALMRRAGMLLGSVPWLLPAGRTKNQLLNRLGHDIAEDAQIGPVLMLRCGRVEVGEGAFMGSASIYKDVERISVGRNAVLGGFNLVSAARELADHLSLPSELVLGESAAVTTRHTIDCSAPVTLEPFSILAGHGSQILTHSIDVRRNAQSAQPVTIGERTFVSTRVVMLGGAVAPAHSVIAAGSVVTSGGHEPGALVAGVPAKAKAPISGEWFTRDKEQTNAVYDPVTDRLQDDAF